jgi:hypothetical protein
MVLFAVEMPQEFFTLESMFTLGGATAATFFVANTVQSVFDWNPKWFALLVAQVVCAVGVALCGGTIGHYLVGLVNGCVVYCAAAGGTSFAAATVGVRGEAMADSADVMRPQAVLPGSRRRFLSPWF